MATLTTPLHGFFFFAVLLVGHVRPEGVTLRTVLKGSDLLLLCYIDGTDESRQWLNSHNGILFFGSRKIYYDRRFLLQESEGLTEYHLQISNVIESDDEVVFTCKEGNNTRASYQLDVQTRPSIIGPASSPATVLAAENDTLTLWCNVTGKPRPTVTWYRQRTATQARESIGITGGWLTIHNVTRYASDIYICLARNIIDVTERHIEVKVNYMAVSVAAPEVQAVPGVDAVLACAVQSEPFVAAYWIDKKGRRLHETSSWDYRVVGHTEPLYKMTILTLTVNHNGMENRTGTYVCHAEGNTVVEKAVTIT